jgi:microcystin-dependent protein
MSSYFDPTGYAVVSGTRARASAFNNAVNAISAGFDNVETAMNLKAPLISPALVTPNLGTPSAGVLTNCTGLPIAGCGTGETTAQAAIDALTAVAGATNEHALMKDTATGNAIFKALPVQIFATAAEILAGTEAAKAIAPDQLRLAQVGDVKAVAYETVPAGWLECNGASLLRADYAALFAAISTNFGTADATHFNIPDLRGKFPRGWDHAAANDPDRAARTAQATGGQTGDHVGTVQADGFEAHTHTITRSNTGSATGYTAGGNPLDGGDSGSAGGSETRPINVGVMYIIKY